MNLGDRVRNWADQETSVKAVVLIGSRVRCSDDRIWRADAKSDWDFQIITSRPELFENAGWTTSLGCPPLTYAVRRAAIGGVPKVAALFEETEADFVIVPTWKLMACRVAVAFGFHNRSDSLYRKLQDLAVVVRPGWLFLKGKKNWDPFYRRVVTDVKDPRMDDIEVRNLAEGFVCDAVWTKRKIERGEWLAAQRMIHHSLAETNFRLMHELRLRRGERTFPEARRAEFTLSERDLFAINVCVVPTAESLKKGLERVSSTCRELVRAMLGEAWSWPLLTRF